MEEIMQAKTLSDLEKVRIAYLGKSGYITLMYQELRSLSSEEKKQRGQEINHIKEAFDKAYSEKKEALEKKALTEQLSKESVDISLPARTHKKGSLHPLSVMIQSLKNALTKMGFQLSQGPEIEDEFHNFDALNIPSHHPARQSHDTFFIGDKLLRTHTSTVQIRTMMKSQPPFRIASVGRVYRADDIDATHTPMFHQIEGLVVEKDVTVGHLKGALESLIRDVLEDHGIVLRFRPSFFPFTEPSFEVDIFFKDRWLEILGCGMVHPHVLKNVNLDSEQWQGFAFGMGIERLTMIKYEISDIRYFYENDVRFLHLFS